tara:strand:+ start:627 stop:779 length:153 start_codon:yes stop_codon:yes gene_type:complete
MHPDWASPIRDQCCTAGMPFLFKQWGKSSPAIAEANENSELDAILSRLNG